jgi:hypothetical protein
MFTLTGSYCQSGNIETFFNFSWDKWELRECDSIKNDFLRNHEFVKNLQAIPFIKKSEISKNTHVIDINLDGEYEIVYSGNVGIESDVFVLFQKNNKSYKEIFKTFGNIINLEKSNVLSPLQIVVYNEGCCGNEDDYLEYYSVMCSNENGLEVQLAKVINYFKGTVLPEKIVDPIAFYVVKEKYNLRTDPIIDNSEEPYHPRIIQGNVIEIFVKEDKGYAISEIIDETGRVWWFVIMKTKKMYQSEIDGENYPLYVMGWMSSRFLARKFPEKSK